MRRQTWFWIIGITFLIGALFFKYASPSAALAATHQPSIVVPTKEANQPIPGELVVFFTPGTAASQVAWERVASGIKVAQPPELQILHAAVVRVPMGNEKNIAAALMHQPGIRWVERNYPVSPMIAPHDTIPNDPLWPQQYGPRHIQAPAAWDITIGQSNVIIAVVDSGIDSTHPDLQNQLVPGYDVVERDNQPQDRCGHGTHVAGIIAAEANNNIGVAGMAWQAKIMPVKVLDAHCGGTIADVAEGIIWATQHGARIINLSLGGSRASTLLEDATYYAYQHGVALFAAAGNDGGTHIIYPAAYPWVMAVGATDEADQRASFSDTGPELDIMAPGVDILSTTPREDFYYHDLIGTSQEYGTLSGTSMATAFASGAAALLASTTAYNSPDAIYQGLTQTAKDLEAPGHDSQTGWGLIRVFNALQFSPHLSPTPTPVPPDFAYDMLDSHSCANLVQYHWLDATSDDPTQALPIFGSDGSYTANLPFAFTFAGNTYSQATISENGYVTFGGVGGEADNFFIPGIAEPNNFIAPFWDDLTLSVNGLVFARTFGKAPNRRWIVEWWKVPRRDAPSSRLTFEVVLSEADQSITFQYAALEGPSSRGNSATVGIEYLDGRDGVQYSYNAPRLRSKFAIRFVPRPANAPSLTDRCRPAPSPAPTEPPKGIAVGPKGGLYNFTPFCADIPEGALQGTHYLNVHLFLVGPPAPASWLPLGRYMQVTLTPQQSRFSPPLYLCYHYTDEDVARAGGTPSNIHFATYSPNTYSWTLLPTIANEAQKTVWATVSHFSTFGVFVIFPNDLPTTGAPVAYSTIALGILLLLLVIVLGLLLLRKNPHSFRR